MAQNILRARGLYTFFNSLSEIPEGSLLEADNVVINRNGAIQSRRGFSKYGSDLDNGADRAKQLITYKGRILRHYDDNLEYDSDGLGDFDAFSGSFTETESGLRIKSVEANGNLYFTTDAGIQKISAKTASDFTTSTNFIRSAGGVKALDVTGVVDYSVSGFLSGIDAGGGDETCAVAYRIVWGVKDRNSNLILGAPSSRTVIINTSTTNSGVVELTFTIPPRITTSDTDYFYQIYRTAVIAGVDSDPGDEMNLVIEDFPSGSELTARSVTVTDITPEDFREGNTPLYTNPVSGDGILQANDVPPLAKDIALFKNSVFYANTKTLNRLNLSLISVSQLVSGASQITIDDNSTSTTYTFVGEKEETTITVDTFANTTDGGYFLINSASNIRKYFPWADKTGTTPEPSGLDTVGRLAVRVDISAAVSANDVAVALAAALDALDDFDVPVPVGDTIIVTNSNNGNTDDAVNGATGFGGGAFNISITNQGDGEDASNQEVLLSAAATPSQQIDETARSLVNIINQQSGEIVSAYYISGPEEVPGLILLESRVLGADPFFVTADSSTTGGQFNPELPTSGETVISDNEVKGNRLYFSKYQQPEAVPLVNFLDVGPQDQDILRILPLRESLFVLKSDGVYRVTGENGNFSLDLFDGSTGISTPDSAAVLNNQIYLLTRQDVATISDTGVSIISRPIEDKIVEVVNNNFSFIHTGFGIAYESDRSYWLFLVSEETDTVATQCYRYNTFTNSWTRFILSKTCAVINTSDDKMYLGASDDNFIEKERKNFKRTDFADRDLDFTIPALSVDNTTITLSNISGIEVGDALVQTQFLTIYQFNQLLNKLDDDPGVADTDYFDTLEMVAGDNPRNAVDNLATKLDADTGVNDSNYFASLAGGSDFEDVQDDFNTIVDKLNLDTGVFFSTYKNSEDTLDFEALIFETDRNGNQLTVQYSTPFLEGPVKVYKSIECSVIWAPYTFGDPTMMKHVREGSILFERNNFSRGELAFSSDLSPDFEPIDFTGTGKGDFGLSIWSQHNWGGLGSSIPFRTYIPRDKQRCRYINCRFMHNSAREIYTIFGISYVARTAGQRAYRDSDGT